MASERLPEPITVEKLVVEPNKKLIGPRFKATQKQVIAALEELDGEELATFKASVEQTGSALLAGEFEISAELVTFKSEKKIVCEQK